MIMSDTNPMDSFRVYRKENFSWNIMKVLFIVLMINEYATLTVDDLDDDDETFI